ncbi:hypothetical protein AB0D37_17590 [Streptomyces sp. NPDC048384]|uniref:hypothetical protein n=1 Tax=unclassified Streptomyces TaxID=2593676 RepID=UPI003448CAB9
MTGVQGGPQGGRNGDRLAVAGLHQTRPDSPVTATLDAPQPLAQTPRQSTPVPRSHG